MPALAVGRPAEFSDPLGCRFQALLYTADDQAWTPHTIR